MELPAESSNQLAVFERALSSLEKALRPVLDLSPSALEELDPLEASQVQLGIAQAVTLLFQMYLRTVGIDPAEHPVQKTTDRLLAYSKRVAHYVGEHELSNTQRSLSVDISAANRFIQHAIPDLSDAQKEKLDQAADLKTHMRGKSKKESTAKPGGLTTADGFLGKMQKSESLTPRFAFILGDERRKRQKNNE